MKYEQFLDVYNAGPEATYKLFLSVMETNLRLQAQVAHLEERVKELEDRLNKNSQNSSKPPSSDEFIKPKSQRKKSGKKSGGQKGHRGNTLEMSDAPDVEVTHRVENCQGCGYSLEKVPPKKVERRQEYDIPAPEMTITEHQGEHKDCPVCNLENKAVFPAGVELPVQYGNNLKSLLVYLNQYQLLPYKRTVELIEDIYGHRLSEGTLFNANQAVYEVLAPVEEAAIEQLLASPVNNIDETGLRVEGKRQWLHTISNENVTFYAHHPKRGFDAIEEIGILPRYEGVIVHDFWKPYFKLACNHGLCNAHHLRELTGIHELTEQQWPQELRELLLEIKKTVEQRKASAVALTAKEIRSFEHRYELIIEKGYLENPPPPEPEKKKRGRKKQNKARNLLDRLKEHRREALAFMYDFEVPFDNNLAERSIRMVKVKQKISGVFRSDEGAKMFCRIRGYISMVKKNSSPVLEAIKNALDGKPLIPQS